MFENNINKFEINLSIVLVLANSLAIVVDNKLL